MSDRDLFLVCRGGGAWQVRKKKGDKSIPLGMVSINEGQVTCAGVPPELIPWAEAQVRSFQAWRERHVQGEPVRSEAKD